MQHRRLEVVLCSGSSHPMPTNKEVMEEASSYNYGSTAISCSFPSAFSNKHQYHHAFHITSGRLEPPGLNAIEDKKLRGNKLTDRSLYLFLLSLLFLSFFSLLFLFSFFHFLFFVFLLFPFFSFLLSFFFFLLCFFLK
jgi:hypothetical protein